VRSLAAGRGRAHEPSADPSRVAPAGDRVIVRIVDRGPGIPPAQLERVFEPFYRAGMPGGDHRGSGLGLAIARGFAEANEGSLHVESLPGQGATFVFEFPLNAPSMDAPGEPRTEASSAGPPPAPAPAEPPPMIAGAQRREPG
jgi:signal transduction histidine kinase